VLSALLAAYLLGLWLIPGPNTASDVAALLERTLDDQRGDRKKADVFTIDRQHLWFPKRYEVESDQYRSVVVQAYGPDLVSRTERDSDERNGIKIRFSFHIHDHHASRASITALADKLLASPRESRRWLPELELYEVDNGATQYYFSETYTAPSAEPFYFTCEADSYNVSTRVQNCRAGYLISSLIFLEYGFQRAGPEKMTGWKNLDLAVRKFALAVLWRDGEVSSLDPNMGYDTEGRILRTVGSHTLHFPTRLTSRSYAYPGVSEIFQFGMCLSKETEAAGCPNYDEQVRIFLQANELQQMPNDGEEALARTVRNHAYGPVMLPDSSIEEYRYTEESSARVYRMLDLDPSGRYPIVKCSSWCRSYFIATPGLRVIYDFDRGHTAAWPQIDTRVRKQISELLNPPLL
jgi:hypothetical protein